VSAISTIRDSPDATLPDAVPSCHCFVLIVARYHFTVVLHLEFNITCSSLYSEGLKITYPMSFVKLLYIQLVLEGAVVIIL
jgi:hypothetical protein